MASIKWRRNIAENFNRWSRVHERYRVQTDRRQTDWQTDRQTDGRRHTASSRSLKIGGPIRPSWGNAPWPLGDRRPCAQMWKAYVVEINLRATKGWVVATHSLRFSASCNFYRAACNADAV